MELPPYQADTICPKCGHDKVGTQYQPPFHDSCFDTQCPEKEPERLERRCERCRFAWPQATVPPPLLSRG